jgi:hypothetical protein
MADRRRRGGRRADHPARGDDVLSGTLADRIRAELGVPAA